MILSLWLAFYLGERGYNRDRKDKIEEHKQLVKSEVELLKNSLKQLLIAVTEQIAILKAYNEEQNFILGFRADVQVDFLKFIDIKNVYEYYGIKDQNKIDSINELLSLLFSLHDFRHSLRDSLRTALEKHTIHEQGFYLYRKLMYKILHEIANKRAIEIKPEVGGFKINFGGNDFAEQFFHLNQAVLANPDLMTDKNEVDRPKLIELFIMPVIELSSRFIPLDEDAIEVSDVANEVNSSWINMKAVMSAHYSEIDTHIATLEKVEEEIQKFLELKK